jgi:hypothetical protein
VKRELITKLKPAYRVREPSAKSKGGERGNNSLIDHIYLSEKLDGEIASSGHLRFRLDLSDTLAPRSTLNLSVVRLSLSLSLRSTDQASSLNFWLHDRRARLI